MLAAPFSSEDLISTLHNPRWALSGTPTDQSPIALDCMQYGQPGVFVASPLDPEPHGVEIWNDAKAGVYGAIMPYVAPPETVDEAMSRQTYETRNYLGEQLSPREPGPDRQVIYTEMGAATVTHGHYLYQIPKPWNRPVEASDQPYFDAALGAYTETIDYLNAQLAGRIVLPPLKVTRRK
jgi:hypothetical protein